MEHLEQHSRNQTREPYQSASLPVCEFASSPVGGAIFGLLSSRRMGLGPSQFAHSVKEQTLGTKRLVREPSETSCSKNKKMANSSTESPFRVFFSVYSVCSVVHNVVFLITPRAGDKPPLNPPSAQGLKRSRVQETKKPRAPASNTDETSEKKCRRKQPGPRSSSSPSWDRPCRGQRNGSRQDRRTTTRPAKPGISRLTLPAGSSPHPRYNCPHTSPRTTHRRSRACHTSPRRWGFFRPPREY